MEVKRGYKRTEVGVVPDDWEVRQMAELTDKCRPISYGIVQTGPNIIDGIPCLRVLDINEGQINNQTNSTPVNQQYTEATTKQSQQTNEQPSFSTVLGSILPPDFSLKKEIVNEIHS